MPSNSETYTGSLLPPLHLYVNMGFGYLINLFPVSMHLVVITLLEMFSEPICLYLPLALLTNTLNAPHFHKTIRHSLITLVILQPFTIHLPQQLFLGLVLFTMWALLDGQVEISGASMGLASALNQYAVWMLPVYILIIMFQVFSRSMRGRRQLDFNALNGLFSELSTTFMIFLLTLCTPWIQLVSLDGGFQVIEKVLSRIYLENYSSSS